MLPFGHFAVNRLDNLRRSSRAGSNVCRVHHSKDSDSLITKALAFIVQDAVGKVAQLLALSTNDSHRPGSSDLRRPGPSYQSVA